MKFGKELIASAEEALRIAAGEVEPAAIHIPDAVDVAAIRKRMKLSQTAFAERYGLLPATVRDWEQDRRKPDRAATILLRVIEREPEAVARALQAS